MVFENRFKIPFSICQRVQVVSKMIMLLEKTSEQSTEIEGNHCTVMKLD